MSQTNILSSRPLFPSYFAKCQWNGAGVQATSNLAPGVITLICLSLSVGTPRSTTQNVTTVAVYVCLVNSFIVFLLHHLRRLNTTNYRDFHLT